MLGAEFFRLSDDNVTGRNFEEFSHFSGERVSEGEVLPQCVTCKPNRLMHIRTEDE